MLFVFVLIFKGREVDDYGDIEVAKNSCENPILTEYRGHMLKNVEVSGKVSQNVRLKKILFYIVLYNFICDRRETPIL